MTTATPRESRKITYSSEIRQLKNVPFTENQKSIVIGSVLGDACLHPNWSHTNYTLKITRSEHQKDYIDWQSEQLKPFVLTAPRWYEKTHSYTVRTISHSDLTTLYKEFYPEGKKKLPPKISEYIQNPLILALWFMDDGNAIRSKGILKGYHLNTQSFSAAENQILVDLFAAVHGIRTFIERNHGYCRIGMCSKKARESFRELIREYIIPSMQYKLG